MAAVSAETIENLSRQLAGWAEHQHPAALASRLSRMRGDVMQNRQCKCCGFAGAGLGDPDHVTAGESDRNSLRLNWGRGGVFLFCKRTFDRLGEAKILK